MRMAFSLALILVALGTSGCASGLNSVQKREYEAMKHDDVLIKEKSPGTGAVLGILPGFGSFYAREPALGVVNLLLWPLSILWDPVSGYRGSMTINYDLTKHELKKSMNDEISELDDKLALNQISATDYIIAKKRIEEKYTYD